MSAPGYGQPYGGGQQPPYPEQQSFEDQQPSPPPQAGIQQQVPDHGKKKKRAYAAGAFDVGSGANAAVGGQLPGGGQYGVPPQPATAAYGGYPSQPQQQLPQDPQAAQYGSPQPVINPIGGVPGAVGGYQAPEPYYPSGAGAPSPAGVGGITSGVGSMQLGGAGQPSQAQPAPQGGQARPGPLNQLYPTDLLTQPFNVSELDLPPPPIILPPNVRRRSELAPRPDRSIVLTPLSV